MDHLYKLVIDQEIFRKETAKKYKELLDRLLNEWCKKFEIGPEWAPTIVTEHEGVENYPVKEDKGWGGLGGAMWREKKLLYINTNINGEKEWLDLIKHLLIHYKNTDLQHGIEFDRTLNRLEGIICDFRAKVEDAEVICELQKNHMGSHRQIKGNVVCHF